MQDGDVERMENELRQIFERCKGYEKLVVGCGIVSFGTKPESVLQFKRLYQKLFAL
ncbi:MAG: hypothetical protein LBL83_04840 [Clostridiales bacterium]|nr:hypothetical protein [Clostridiales bacterium]